MYVGAVPHNQNGITPFAITSTYGCNKITEYKAIECESLTGEAHCVRHSCVI